MYLVNKVRAGKDVMYKVADKISREENVGTIPLAGCTLLAQDINVLFLTFDQSVSFGFIDVFVTMTIAIFCRVTF